MEKQSSLDGYKFAGLTFLILVLVAIYYYSFGSDKIANQMSSVGNYSSEVANNVSLSVSEFYNSFSSEEPTIISQKDVINEAAPSSAAGVQSEGDQS